MDSNLKWFLDELAYFRGALHLAGWAFHSTAPVREMSCLLRSGAHLQVNDYGLESRDVQGVHGPAAQNCRFRAVIPGDDPEQFVDLKLAFLLADGSRREVDGLVARRLDADPYYRLQYGFFERLGHLGQGTILEIGSRNRRGDADPYPLLQSSFVRRHLIPPVMDYVGMDIVPAENVDVVGDAHSLGAMFQPERFDAIFAAYVFEHLLMPWKVAVEMNKVLKTGGLVMVLTHQAWPLHELPCDFWRFSDQAWKALFNRFTGFEILETAMGEPASIVPHLLHPTTAGLDLQPTRLMSGVVGRKVAGTALEWPADPAEILTASYPD